MGSFPKQQLVIEPTGGGAGVKSDSNDRLTFSKEPLKVTRMSLVWACLRLVFTDYDELVVILDLNTLCGTKSLILTSKKYDNHHLGVTIAYNFLKMNKDSAKFKL